MGERAPGGRDGERARVFDGGGGGDVGLGDAVVPCEMVLVPEGPEVAEDYGCAGEDVAEAAPEELAGVGQAAVEADNGEAAELHAGRGTGKRGEQEKILRVKEECDGAVNDGVHLIEEHFAAERAEEAEKTGAGQAEEKCVEESGPAALGKGRDGNEGGLGMRAVVGRICKIEFGLNADFHALGLAVALNGARACAFVFADFVFVFLKGNFFVEGKAGLRIVRAENTAAGAIIFEAASDFLAPIGFVVIMKLGFPKPGLARGSSGNIGGTRRGRGDRNGVLRLGARIERDVTEGAIFGVLKQEGTTLRAYAYHWSVLRCGSSSEGTWSIIAWAREWKPGGERRRATNEATRAAVEDS
jgi:hypothetical protein